MDEPSVASREGLESAELAKGWLHTGLEEVDTMAVFAKQGLQGLGMALS